jgi:hypothetical protein
MGPCFASRLTALNALVLHVVVCALFMPPGALVQRCVSTFTLHSCAVAVPVVPS